MRTDTDRLEWLLSALSEADADVAAKRCEALEAGSNLGLRGRELLESAMNAVRFDEEPEKAREVTEQMVAERTDKELLDWMQTELDAGREIEMFITPGRVPGTDGEKVVRTRLVYGSMNNHSNAIGIDLRSSLKTLRDYVEPSVPTQEPEA